jgi:hypothetical protein
MDIRFNGTASSGVAVLTFETNSSISASQGQVWANSIYAKNISTTSQANQILLTTYEYNSIGVYLTEGSVNIKSTLSTSLNRFEFIKTLSSLTVARIQTLLQFVLTNGASYDFTIRVAQPQMELGAYASSPIFTTSASATRVADACSKTGISSLIGQSEGVLFADIITTEDITSVLPIGISDGTGSNRVLLYTASSTAVALVTVGGIAQATITSGTILPNTRYKMAIAYKANDFAFYLNGSLVGTDTSGTVPACSKFAFDNGSGSAVYYGKTNEALLFKTRLTNDELISLTTL